MARLRVILAMAVAALIALALAASAAPAAPAAHAPALMQREPGLLSWRRLRRRSNKVKPAPTQDDDEDEDKPPGQVVLAPLPGVVRRAGTADVPGDVQAALVQVLAVTPPEPDEQGAFDGPFKTFIFDWPTGEEQARLANRSFLFKGEPYEQPLVLTLGSNASTAGDASLSVPNIAVDPPREIPLADPLADTSDARLRAEVTPDDSGVALFSQPALVGAPVRTVQPQVWGTLFIPYSVALARDAAVSASSYTVAVPDEGAKPHFAVLSDVDDTLKITNSTNPRWVLRNSFTKPYAPVPGMPELLSRWVQQAVDAAAITLSHHYVTAMPAPLAPALVPFLHAWFPPGSVHMRPVSPLQDTDNALRLLFEPGGDVYRSDMLRNVTAVLPARSMLVLLGDTTRTSVNVYFELVREMPDRVACIYLRDLKATGSGGGERTALSREDGVDMLRRALPQDQQDRAERMLVIFSDPDQVQGEDWAGGKCVA